MPHISSTMTARIVNVLIYISGFMLFLSGAFGLQRLLIPGDIDTKWLVAFSLASLAILTFTCLWAGDFWRRSTLVLLLVAFAVLICVGGGILTGLAIGNWRQLASPLAIKALLLVVAGLSCLHLAKKLKGKLFVVA